MPKKRGRGGRGRGRGRGNKNSRLRIQAERQKLIEERREIPNNVLQLNNVSPFCNESYLATVFNKYVDGKVEVEREGRQTDAKVTFPTSAEAQKARAELNGKWLEGMKLEIFYWVNASALSKTRYLWAGLDEAIVDKLQMDSTALYSVTERPLAKIQSKIALAFSTKGENSVITDGTACVGGNTCMFAEDFKSVIACENDDERFDMLCNNLEALKVREKVQPMKGDYTTLHDKIKQDMIFLDPPWGGTDYRSRDKVICLLNTINVGELTTSIRKCDPDVHVIILKLPCNYDMEDLVEKIGSEASIMVCQFKNQLVVVADYVRSAADFQTVVQAIERFAEGIETRKHQFSVTIVQTRKGNTEVKILPNNMVNSGSRGTKRKRSHKNLAEMMESCGFQKANINKQAMKRKLILDIQKHQCLKDSDCEYTLRSPIEMVNERSMQDVRAAIQSHNKYWACEHTDAPRCLLVTFPRTGAPDGPVYVVDQNWDFYVNNPWTKFYSSILMQASGKQAILDGFIVRNSIPTDPTTGRPNAPLEFLIMDVFCWKGERHIKRNLRFISIRNICQTYRRGKDLRGSNDTPPIEIRGKGYMPLHLAKENIWNRVKFQDGEEPSAKRLRKSASAGNKEEMWFEDGKGRRNRTVGIVMVPDHRPAIIGTIVGASAAYYAKCIKWDPTCSIPLDVLMRQFTPPKTHPPTLPPQELPSPALIATADLQEPERREVPQEQSIEKNRPVGMGGFSDGSRSSRHATSGSDTDGLFDD